ncbi:MAG: hypothetical protein OHK0029_35000 [Armatimonadaceae bacterium]
MSLSRSVGLSLAGILTVASLGWIVLGHQPVAAHDESADPALLSQPVQPQPPQETPKTTPSQELTELVNQGRGQRNDGDYDAALATFKKALAIAHTGKDLPGQAMVLNNIASILRYQSAESGSLPLAKKSMEVYEQALDMAQRAGSKYEEGYARLYLGELTAKHGEASKALLQMEKALALFEEVENDYYVARTLARIGETTLYKSNKPAEALPYFERSLPLFRKAEVPHEALVAIDHMKVAYTKLMANNKPQDPTILE